MNISKVKKFVRKCLNRYEEVDPTPVAMPVGFHRPPTLAEQVARLVKSHEWNREMVRRGRETFDEANDFDVEDPEDHPFTTAAPWEEQYEGQFDDEVKMERTRDDIVKGKRPKPRSKFEEESPKEKVPKKKAKSEVEDED